MSDENKKGFLDGIREGVSKASPEVDEMVLEAEAMIEPLELSPSQKMQLAGRLVGSSFAGWIEEVVDGED